MRIDLDAGATVEDHHSTVGISVGRPVVTGVSGAAARAPALLNVAADPQCRPSMRPGRQSRAEPGPIDVEDREQLWSPQSSNPSRCRHCVGESRYYPAPMGGPSLTSNGDAHMRSRESSQGRGGWAQPKTFSTNASAPCFQATTKLPTSSRLISRPGQNQLPLSSMKPTPIHRSPLPHVKRSGKVDSLPHEKCPPGRSGRGACGRAGSWRWPGSIARRRGHGPGASRQRG